MTLTLRIECLDGGEYLATCDAVAGVWACGPTPEAAADEWIEVYREWLRL
jgi:predicted RNase H-like HicB family nuclease